MANRSEISIDSLGESELELLREKLKQKEHIIAEKSEIISSLRQQVNDLHGENEELENNQQLLYQKIDRLTKQCEEKAEELESVSHALKEVEASYETISKKLEARTGQLQKFVDDLLQARKELEASKSENDNLKHKNERLTAELDLANAKKRSRHDLEREEEQHLCEELRRKDELNQLKRNGVGEANASSRNKPEPVSAIINSFPIADEIGEFMDSSSALPTIDRLSEIQHLSSTGRMPAGAYQAQQLVRQQAQQHHDHHHYRQHETHGPLIGRAAPSTINEPRYADEAPTLAINNYCSNHRLSRNQTRLQQQEPLQQKENLDNQCDPIVEYKMRVERANELARRNMQTKPLHQTSYPLELDTFDTTDLTELDIKRGIVDSIKQSKPPAREQLSQLRQPPQRQPPQPPKQQRPALANYSNTPPKRVYKKAEAFIV